MDLFGKYIQCAGYQETINGLSWTICQCRQIFKRVDEESVHQTIDFKVIESRQCANRSDKNSITTIRNREETIRLSIGKKTCIPKILLHLKRRTSLNIGKLSKHKHSAKTHKQTIRRHRFDAH